MNSRLTMLGLAALLLLALSGPGLAHTPASTAGDYDLSWWTVDGGGATFQLGGRYALGAAAGQPDAMVWHGDGYTLAGGFWHDFWPGEPVGPARTIYLPLVQRSYP